MDVDTVSSHFPSPFTPLESDAEVDVPNPPNPCHFPFASTLPEPEAKVNASNPPPMPETEANASNLPILSSNPDVNATRRPMISSICHPCNEDPFIRPSKPDTLFAQPLDPIQVPSWVIGCRSKSSYFYPIFPGPMLILFFVIFFFGFSGNRYFFKPTFREFH